MDMDTVTVAKMTLGIFNQREKLAAPPFVTVSVKDGETRINIFKTRSKMDKYGIEEKSSIFACELDLLRAFVVRKGTQLRLEKALMLTKRILTLVLRWKSNTCWNEFYKFKDAFEFESKAKGKKRVEKRQCKDTYRVKGNLQEIRLPSRQWANWVIYLTLRDLLLLSKIKYECERAVGYWLGMISCSHHPSDSLIIVGILSRIWAVSSGMVEEYANHVYPSLCYISSLLSPTKAENWLQDIDFPNDLFTWLEKILGFPFEAASIGGSEHIFTKESRKEARNKRRSSSSGKSKMDRVLAGASRSSGQDDKSLLNRDTPSSSSRMRDVGYNVDDEETEDLGEPITMQQQSPTTSKKLGKAKTKKKQQQTQSVQTKKKLCLDERWAKFFKNFKSKLATDSGRKQLLTRIKKYKKLESNTLIRPKLVKLRKLLIQNDQDSVRIFIPKFKRFLSKRLS